MNCAMNHYLVKEGRCEVFRRLLLLAMLAGLVTFAYKRLAPDVRRYIEMSRM